MFSVVPSLGVLFSVSAAIQPEFTTAPQPRGGERHGIGTTVYNWMVIGFAHFAMHVLTVMFFVGLAGSSVVVVISFVEDLGELLGE